VEQLNRLHWHDAQRHWRRRQLEVAGVSADDLDRAPGGRPAGDRQALRASLELAGQRLIALEGDYAMAATGQVECHPSRAGADIEDRPTSTRCGQLTPQRQIGGVGAALEVVPDHRCGAHARTQELAA
jgi:hypothetical protein